MSPLDALENAREWIPPIHDLDDGQKYNELADELECHNNDLLKLVPVDKHRDFYNVLISYKDCMTKIGALEKKNVYKTGLRDGFLLAVEMLVVQGENTVIKRPGLGDYLDRYRKAL